jgi:MFS family permease
MLRVSRSLQGFDRRLWILFGGRVISSTGFSIVMPFLSIFLYTQMGVPMTVVGMVFLGTAVAGAFGQIVGGELADRLGRRPVMWASMGFRGLVFLLLSLVIASFADLRLIATLLMASSFMGSLFEPATNAMVADLVPPGRRLEAYSLLRVGQNVGWTLGPLMGGILAMFSYPSLFLVTAFTSLSVAVIIFTQVMDPQRIAGHVDRFRPRDLLKIGENRAFLLFCLASLPLFIVLGQMSSTFALFSEDVVGISVAEVGYLYALNGIMVVFLQFPMARYINRFRMSHVLAAGALMYAAGYLMVGWASDIWILVVSMIVTTLGENTTSPSSTNFVANISPENERGRYMGVSGIFHSFGWSVGPLVGGVLYDSLFTMPLLLWGIIAAIASVSAVGFYFLGKLSSESIDRMPGGPAGAKS